MKYQASMVFIEQFYHLEDTNSEILFWVSYIVLVGAS